MPLDRRAERLLAMLAASQGGDPAAETPQARRAALAALARMVDDDLEPVAAVEDRAIPGPGGPLALRLYAPAGSAGVMPGLVFFHGGGWVAGGLDTHDGLCRRIANRAGCRLIAVDYRLAPEHPFPAAVDDCLAATRWASDNARALGIDPARLMVGGDSAGGGLAAAVCQMAARDGGPAIAAQLLICPILDLSRETPSRAEFAEGYFISRAALSRDIDDYCGPHVDRADPRLSPLRAERLAGQPPAVLLTAEYDPFRDEGGAYARRLAEAGVAVRRLRREGMIHYFYAMPGAIPQALSAAEAIGAELRTLLAAV
jgi:acetyl esterase/lipase